MIKPMPDMDMQGAMVFAFKLLGLRSHSREELERKLLKKGYAKEITEQALEKLTAQGLLDDRMFAEAFIRSRAKRKPAGKLKIRGELRKKGVADTVIGELLQEFNTGELCMLAAEKKIRSLHGLSETDRKNKLERFLHNRGFEWQDIQPVIRSFFSAGPDSEER
jgi:regulatory protein